MDLEESNGDVYWYGNTNLMRKGSDVFSHEKSTFQERFCFVLFCSGDICSISMLGEKLILGGGFWTDKIK